MNQQPSTFHRYPPKEKIQKRIEMMERRVAGPVSYMLYIMPVAKKFGDRVYDVAAASLQASGVQVTAKQLRVLATELSTPEGMEKHRRAKWEHIYAITPIILEGEEW